MHTFDIAKWRRHFGLTQAEAASLIGTSRVTIGKWEAGSTHPSAADIHAFYRIGDQLMKRPEYGPVELNYYSPEQPPEHGERILPRVNQKFDTNEDALRWLTDHWSQLPAPEGSWIEQGIHQIWYGRPMKEEIERRLMARKSQRTPEEIEAEVQSMMEFARRFREQNPDATFLTDDEMYDEYGLPK